MTLPQNARKALRLAGEHGWEARQRVVWVGHVDSPPALPSTMLGFRKAGFPDVWALWKGNSFHRSYARTAQRLGAGDLFAVLMDPDILTDVDPDNPFANETDGLPVA